MPTLTIDQETARQLLRTADRCFDLGALRQRQRAPFDELRQALEQAQERDRRERREGYEQQVAGCESCGIRVSQCPECAGRLELLTEFVEAPPTFCCIYCRNDYDYGNAVELQRHYDSGHIGTAESNWFFGEQVPFAGRCRAVNRDGQRCWRDRSHLATSHEAPTEDQEASWQALIVPANHCADCGVYYAAEWERRVHRVSYHGESLSDVYAFACEDCYLGYDNQREYDQHMRDYHAVVAAAVWPPVWTATPTVA